MIELPCPIPNKFTSKPLIFVVEGRVYAGHYHENGWFYNDRCDDDDDELFNAPGPKAISGIVSSRDPKKLPQVTEWYYLNNSKEN